MNISHFRSRTINHGYRCCSSRFLNTLANKAENPSLGLNLWRAGRLVSCGAAERVASSPSCQLAVSACVLDSVSVPEYFLLSAVLSIDRHMTATCGSCEDAGWEAGCCHGGPTDMFVQSCREERGCRIFSTDPLLQGAGRAEPRSLQDDRKRSNSRTTFTNQMDPTVCILTTSVKSLVLHHVILCCSVREDFCCFTPTDRNRTSAGSRFSSACQTKHSCV